MAGHSPGLGPLIESMSRAACGEEERHRRKIRKMMFFSRATMATEKRHPRCLLLTFTSRGSMSAE